MHVLQAIVSLFTPHAALNRATTEEAETRKMLSVASKENSAVGTALVERLQCIEAIDDLVNRVGSRH